METGDGSFLSSRLSSSLHVFPARLTLFAHSVPVGVASIAIIMWLFPHVLWSEPATKKSVVGSMTRNLIKRLDIVGTMLMLGTCLMLTTGLQQAALGYSFTSPFVLPLLICSGPFCLAFFIWQWFITTKRELPEPVFPWRFCQSRVRIGTIMYVDIWSYPLYPTILETTLTFS